MPGALVQRPVKVRNEVVLGEVQFDLAEELRENNRPDLYGCGAALFFFFGV